MDVLREVGNIGAGNAATALSKLLDKPIDMKVPVASLVSFEEISERVGGAEAVVIAIFLRVEGDAPGNMFYIISQDQARKLLLGLPGLADAISEEGYSELELSALNEIGNILAGSYLSSLADFTGLRLTPTVPSLAVDMAAAILSYGLLQFGTMGEDALLIETVFMEDREAAEAHFFLIPDPDSFKTMFEALGVPME